MGSPGGQEPRGVTELYGRYYQERPEDFGWPGPPEQTKAASGSGSRWVWGLLAAAAGGLVVLAMYSNKKTIFISFDYDNDRNYRYLLSALKANAGSAIDFEDVTPSEIQSIDVGRIKSALTQKIKLATHTLVIIGDHANDRHPDYLAIGTRNWQWWEIERSKAEGKGLIAVKITNSSPSPDPILSSNAKWASFTVDSMLKAINEA